MMTYNVLFCHLAEEFIDERNDNNYTNIDNNKIAYDATECMAIEEFLKSKNSGLRRITISSGKYHQNNQDIAKTSFNFKDISKDSN